MAVNLTWGEQVLEAFRRWLAAEQALGAARREVNRCESELLNAESELGKLLVPEQAQAGEVFNLWVESKLYSVTRRDQGMSRYEVKPWKAK